MVLVRFQKGFATAIINTFYRRALSDRSLDCTLVIIHSLNNSLCNPNNVIELTIVRFVDREIMTILRTFQSLHHQFQLKVLKITKSFLNYLLKYSLLLFILSIKRFWVLSLMVVLSSMGARICPIISDLLSGCDPPKARCGLVFDRLFEYVLNKYFLYDLTHWCITHGGCFRRMAFWSPLWLPNYSNHTLVNNLVRPGQRIIRLKLNARIYNRIWNI